MYGSYEGGFFFFAGYIVEVIAIIYEIFNESFSIANTTENKLFDVILLLLKCQSFVIYLLVRFCDI